MYLSSAMLSFMSSKARCVFFLCGALSASAYNIKRFVTNTEPRNRWLLSTVNWLVPRDQWEHKATDWGKDYNNWNRPRGYQRTHSARRLLTSTTTCGKYSANVGMCFCQSPEEESEWVSKIIITSPLRLDMRTASQIWFLCAVENIRNLKTEINHELTNDDQN